jgi:uncharacterized membrane protein YbaN (DUF454 family)
MFAVLMRPRWELLLDVMKQDAVILAGMRLLWLLALIGFMIALLFVGLALAKLALELFLLCVRWTFGRNLMARIYRRERRRDWLRRYVKRTV